jgi:Dockerin type I domain
MSVFANSRVGMLGLILALVLGLGAAAQAAAPPPAPPLTVDPSQSNLFYGAVPPSGQQGPVVVFIHGLSGTFMDWIEVNNCPDPGSLPAGYNCKGGGNTMYDMAYQAGFRTVFPSLSPDLSPNTSNIQQNAAMLQTMFPKILAHYNVTQVYFVCHSKGGLDLQDAIANPQWLTMAKAVITLSTPNQGDALADWIFSPAGQGIGQLLGLLNPGEQSLEIANVLQLRTQWDPIFQTANIPFYTLSGDTYVCAHSGGSTCSTQITGPILCSITGGTNTSCKGAPANDGLVDHPESLLPTSYAMELGIVHANHFAMELGIDTFSFIYDRVIQQENSQPGITKIGTGGFGDQHNTWAWSLAWFKGKLYVGTGREVYCVTSATSAIKLGISALYPPAIGDCTPDYHHLPLQAEIWQYTPGTNTWVRVYQSPNSLTTTDNKGMTVATARDIGFRSLSLVTEPDGTQALYAGGVTSGSIFEKTPGTWAPPRLLRSVDGVNWAPLPQAPGTFLGDLTKNGTAQYPIYSVRSGQQASNGVLFLQVGDYPGVGRVISSIPGTNPAGGNNNYQWASPPTEQLPVWILENYNNFVYAGTGTPPGAPPATYGVFKTSGTGPAPYTWTPVVTDGGYATGLVSDYVMSMEIFASPDCPGVGCLYAGTDRPNELIRIHPDDSWDLVVGNPRTIPPGQPGAGQVKDPLSGVGQYFNNGFTGHFWRMGVGGQGLYMGTWDWSSDNSYQPSFGPLWAQEFGTDLWRTNDGTHWTSVSKIGLGDGNNTGSRSFAATPFGLYMGSARSVGGTQIFNVDNSTMDYNHDSVIDENDVTMLTRHLGNLASGPNDPMDLDRDGLLTENDVQLLKSQCTYANCAIPAKLPAFATLSAPVLHSAPGQLGGPIALDWTPVSGAYDYLVYRIALSPSETLPPPGVNGSGVVAGGLRTVATQTAVSSQLAAKCNTNPAGAYLQVCYPYRQPHTSASSPQYGYPGPPQLLGRVTGTTFSDTSLTTLQQLYYVVAEDSSGGLSTPSNLVGGPSLAAQ